jgi:ATP-binding cassette subfamily F protein 3
MIEKIAKLEEALSPTEHEANIHINLPAPERVPRIVYDIEKGAIGYNTPLSQKVMLTIEKSSRIAIIGANGIGKSTLLRTIAGKIPPLAGRFAAGTGVNISYFSQDQAETLDFEASILENVLKLGNLGEKEARSLLGGLLFRGDDVKKKVKVLSGGEKSRVGLAVTLSKTAGLLLLDEPTNHLDMTSVETLSRAFASFSGTVLFVSHDRGFIDGVATHVFAMLPDGRSMLFPGKLADYERLAMTCGFPNVLAHSEPVPATVDEIKPAATAQIIRDVRKQKQRLVREIDKIQIAIDQLSESILKLDHDMAQAAANGHYTDVNKLDQEKSQFQDQKEQLEEQWLSLSDELERSNAD